MRVRDYIKEEKIYTSNNLIEKPIVSIIMPTYCRGDNGLLERSISSVIKQRFKEWELIIIDDGSKDSTRDVIEKFMENDNRIIYIRNEVNSTLPAVRVNQGLFHARGRYIAYQFDDDRWYDDALEVLYKEVIKYDELVFVYGSARYVNIINNKESILGREFSTSLFKRGNIVPNNAVIHPKELLYLYGSYDCSKEMRRLSDWELWRRWSLKVPMIYVNKIISIVDAQQPMSLALNYKINILKVMEERADIYDLLSLTNIMEYEID